MPGLPGWVVMHCDGIGVLATRRWWGGSWGLGAAYLSFLWPWSLTERPICDKGEGWQEENAFSTVWVAHHSAEPVMRAVCLCAVYWLNFHLRFAQLTLKVISMTSELIWQPWLEAQAVKRIAGTLNYFLKYLTGVYKHWS